jgi:hypothetical protein
MFSTDIFAPRNPCSVLHRFKLHADSASVDWHDSNRPPHTQAISACLNSDEACCVVLRRKSWNSEKVDKNEARMRLSLLAGGGGSSSGGGGVALQALKADSKPSGKAASAKEDSAPEMASAEDKKGFISSVFGFGRKKEERKEKQKEQERRLEELKRQQQQRSSMFAAGVSPEKQSPGKDDSWNIADAEVEIYSRMQANHTLQTNSQPRAHTTSLSLSLSLTHTHTCVFVCLCVDAYMALKDGSPALSTLPRWSPSAVLFANSSIFAGHGASRTGGIVERKRR